VADLTSEHGNAAEQKNRTDVEITQAHDAILLHHFRHQLHAGSWPSLVT
jgi:hypothetical protein